MKKILHIICFIICSGYLYAQCPSGPSASCNGSGSALNLYWVGTAAGNNGLWNTPCSWRVDSVNGVEPCQAPRSIDNVFFMPESFSDSAGLATITINTQARCNHLFVSEDIDTLSNTPTFFLTNPGFLEIYGSFTLQSNLTWTVDGGQKTGPELFFKATTVGQTIKTGGQILGSVVFDGIGGEWSLQDTFNAGSFNFINGNFNTSDGVTDHDMNLVTFSSTVDDSSAAVNRIINLNNSTITILGVTGDDRYPYLLPDASNSALCVWGSRNSGSANTNFIAGGSNIVFTANSSRNRLGALGYNKITHTGTGYFQDHFGSTPCTIDTIETDGYFTMAHSFTANVMKINTIGRTHSFTRNFAIATDLIVEGDLCNPTTLKGDQYVRNMGLPDSISSSMEGFIISNLRCIKSGAATQDVIGWSEGNTTGWNIAPPAGRNLYWVGDSSNNWSDPTNWSTDASGVPVLSSSDCPPNQGDDVYFISPLADGDSCVLDAEAYCKSMTWNITNPNTAYFVCTSNLNVFGNLTLDEDMNISGTGNCLLKGDENFVDTNYVISATKRFYRTYFYFSSKYELLDSLSAIDIISLSNADYFKSNGYGIQCNRFYISRPNTSYNYNIEGSNIWMLGSAPLQTNGVVLVSDSASKFIFTSGSSVLYFTTGGVNTFPAMLFQNSSSTIRFRQYTKNCTWRIQGNLEINGNGRFYGDYISHNGGPGNLKGIYVDGDLILNTGKLYEFGLNDTLRVLGDVIGLGTCVSPITIRGIDNTPFVTDFQGNVNLSAVQMANSTSVSPDTLTNCFDFGGNTNWVFDTLAGDTFYWRADNGTCPSCDYNNNWSSTTNWTNTATDTEGSAGCLPGPNDVVVFDSLSFNGSSTASITISEAAFCDDLHIVNSDVRFLGSDRLSVSGNVSSDGTALFSGFTGELNLVASDTAFLDFGGQTLGCEVKFNNTAGVWLLENNFLTTTKSLSLNGGHFITNNQTVTILTFSSDNSNSRALYLGNSTLNVTGSGNLDYIGSFENDYTWNVEDASNFNFNADNSIINFSNANSPIFISDTLNYNEINFTNVTASISTSPIVLGNSMNTKYMKFYGSGRIYGNNSYDTLEFTPGNVYRLEQGSTQTINAPNGILIATGSSGSEIAIKSTSTGVDATIFKDNTGGSGSSMCFDYISVEDNIAASNDPLFSFFTGINSNNISASGIWDFTRPLFFTPSITADEDQFICDGTTTEVQWDFAGSGPYTFVYHANGVPQDTVILPNGTPNYTISVSPSVNTEYTISSFTADNCGSNVTATILDTVQLISVPSIAAISASEDSSICSLSNEATFVHFQESQNGTDRLLLSISDDAGGVGLGQTTVTIRVDSTVLTNNDGAHYMQRHYGITPTNDEAATVRLYFTQAELDSLEEAMGTTLSLSDLRVVKYSNDVLDFSGAETVLVPTDTGSVPGGVTTTANVFYVEINISSFSHLLLMPAINIFEGGTSDGYAQSCYSQGASITNNSIFAGGTEDGFEFSCYTQTNAITNNTIFAGGSSDGFDIGCVMQNAAILNNSIFGGGDEDGFFMNCFDEGRVRTDDFFLLFE